MGCVTCVSCVLVLCYLCVDCLFPLHDVLNELEVEQNRVSLGCVYPAHGRSASNMTV